MREYPNSIFYERFIHIVDTKDYLSYFSDGAIGRQAKYIINYYSNEQSNLDRQFIYLTEENMNWYVLNTTEVIEKIGKEKKIL